MAVQMHNLKKLRSSLGIRRIDRVQNGWIRESCGVPKGVNERIALHWLGHIGRMKNDRIIKRVYVGECGGSRLVGQP